MYLYHSIFKSNECLICFKPIDEQFFLLSLFANPSICLNCFKQFHVINEKKHFDGCELFVLYEYNDFFKSLLFRFKGQYDLVLAPAFLSFYINDLKRRYAHCIVVACPSSKKQNEIRGFAPMEEIAKTLGLPLFTGLIKVGEHKQAEQTFENRKDIYKHISIIGGEELYHREILLIDDVMTSGHTLKACINCLREKQPKKISILVLSRRLYTKTLSSENSF